MVAWQGRAQQVARELLALSSLAHCTVLRAAFVAVLLAGCPSDPPGGGGAGGEDVGAGGAGGEGGAMGGAGGETATFDCATASDQPQGIRVMSGPRGYHGLAIDKQGLIFGLDPSNTLTRSTYEGDWAPFVPNVMADQIAFTGNGHLIMAAPEGLVGITPEAQRFTINGELYGYGLRIGPDGRAYLAEPKAIRRVNLVTGVAETVINMPDIDEGTFAHAFDWSPSFDKLYVGMTGESGGNVRVVALDAELNASGALEPFVDIAPGSVWIDGVGTDICGNVYVANFATSQLFRVTPDGQSTLYVDWSIDPSQYGHGLIFGNGIGGFREDALYLPMPYAENAVQEIIVGVPSREWAGTAINAVAP
jgi:sugar lactone lactonase YvrE